MPEEITSPSRPLIGFLRRSDKVERTTLTRRGVLPLQTELNPMEYISTSRCSRAEFRNLPFQLFALRTPMLRPYTRKLTYM